MAALTTSLEACPKRVINYQTYVKTGEKGEKACQRVDSQPYERTSSSNKPTFSNLYCLDYQQENKSHLHFKTQVLITFLFIFNGILHCSLQF